MVVYAVIMAGGRGTRLWPLSTQEHPKQTHSFVGDNTLFQDAVRRIKSFNTIDHILVIAENRYLDELKLQEPSIPEPNFISEPSAMGTASCIGLAAVHVAKYEPNAVMIVLTADHYIGNVKGFHKALNAAVEVASKDYLVTLGIKPSEPSIGFGYIEHGNFIEKIGQLNVYKVNRFTEKPDRTKALEMFRSGKYSWNSGMFIWRVDRILNEFKVNMPDHYQQLIKIMDSIGTPLYPEILEKSWKHIYRETIDYGIMEKASNIAVIPININWSDLGSWSSLFKILPKDTNGNIVKGDNISIDTKNSLLIGKKKLIATIGVNNLIIIDTKEALLICDKSQDQRVRDLVKKIEAREI
jgi:mannose-1-phosphate guanylyltransferase